MQTALVKIEQDSSNFSIFVTMLHDTPGLDIADIVEERLRELSELWYMYVIIFFIACQPKVNQRKKNGKKYPPPSPQRNTQ